VTARLPLDAQGVLVADLPGALPETLYGRFGLLLPLGLSLGAIITGFLISLNTSHKLR
jgi:apolipoprotein N-acyltransferase